MKLKHTIWIFFLTTSIVWGQQSTQYSLYKLNPYAFNPAYAGMEESLSFTGVYRQQWVGLNGSPRSQNISIHLPLYFLGGGVGLNMNNDEIGAHRNTKASLSYAKHLKLGDNGQLAIGAMGGIAQQAFNGSKLRTPEGDYDETDGVVIHNDDFLSENNIASIAPTFGLGLYFKNEKIQVGLSTDNLAESAFPYTLENEKSELQNKRHYYLYADYRLDLGDYFSVRPSVLGKTDLVEFQTDLSVMLTYNEIIFVGTSFRGFNPNTTDALVLMAGMQINANVRFAYAYDLNLSPLKTANSGSHEILIKYNINKKIGAGTLPPIIYNPRSL